MNDRSRLVEVAFPLKQPSLDSGRQAEIAKSDSVCSASASTANTPVSHRATSFRTTRNP